MQAGRPDNQQPAIAGVVRRNIEMMARLEDEVRNNRSLPDRVADTIAGFSGSLWFVLSHVVVYGLWIVINVGWIPGVPEFDPYPFMLLAMTVSLEAIFLSTFVLMKQNRMSRHADRRAHLDLQVNLLAEREMTMVLQMLQSISARLGVTPASGEVEELSEETVIEALASELQDKLPAE